MPAVSVLAFMGGHFIIWYDVLALLKLEDHFRPSFQSVSDVKVWTHNLPGMLHRLLECSNI